ncbi:MAG: hypothetical protein ACRDPW_06585, partial [Mycobacteriales bacterium]
SYLRHQQPQLLTDIVEAGKLADDTIEALKNAVERVKESFRGTATAKAVNEAAVDALANEARENEKVKRYNQPEVRR